MKTTHFLTFLILMFHLNSCSISPDASAKSAVESYLEENLNNPDSYCSISFSKLEKVKVNKISNSKPLSQYKIVHEYSILNSDKDRVKMTVPFSLDKDFNINESEQLNINGDYGKLDLIVQ